MKRGNCGISPSYGQDADSDTDRHVLDEYFRTESPRARRMLTSMLRGYMASKDTESLDYGPDDDHSLLETMPDPMSEDPQEEIMKKLGLEAVKREVNRLPERQRKIIKIRYLETKPDGSMYTRKEVGEYLGIHPGSVLFDEESALKRIRKALGIELHTRNH